MNAFTSTVVKVIEVLHTVAGAALTFMMFITVADVLGRSGGSPIMGTYEIVGLSGGVVIGFAIPLTSWERAHIYMDFFLDRLSNIPKRGLMTLTRILCILLFLFIGYNLLQLGANYYRTGEVSHTLQLPIFPVVYGVAICCFIECLVFVCDIFRIWEGGDG